MPETDDLVIALARRFIERKDVKAFQKRSGAYEPDRTPITMGDLRAHLAGTKTMGHYVVSPEGNSRVLTYDIDLNKIGSWTKDGEPVEINPREVWLDDAHPARFDLVVQLRCVAEVLARKLDDYLGGEHPVAVSYSGSKGLHVYGFVGSMPAGDVRAIGRDVLTEAKFAAVRGDCFFAHETGFKNLSVELYPKQDSLDGKDLGNLVKLPLGVDRRTTQRSYFLDLTKGYGVMEADDPTRVLETGSIVD